jgi:RNA polymerase sigma-70 factor, ECF subfamily
MNLEPLRALWDGHSRAVYAYLWRLTKNEADAADFLQDLYCRLARQPALVEKLLAGEARGYLLRLAHNAVVDQVRRAQTRERIFEKITTARAGEFATNEGPDEALLRRELLAALAELPEEQRAIVHGRLWKMRTLDELARELGISINTAASRYRYGVDKMRGRLRSLYEDFATRASTNSIQS